MFKLITPTVRMSIGLASVVVALSLTGVTVGLLPDGSNPDAAARLNLVKVIASRLIDPSSRRDRDAIFAAVKAIQEVNPEIVSIGVRQASGEILAASPSHDRVWQNLPKDRLPTEQAAVELTSGDQNWGRIEIRFRDASREPMIAGLPKSRVMFVIYLGLTAAAAFYFYLRQILKELDPSQVVPERVQRAFDTMSEGVLIVDVTGAILLANRTFCTKLGSSPAELTGRKASELPWINHTGPQGKLPWETSLENKETFQSVPISLGLADDKFCRYLVNVTPIDDDGQVRGAIVTFDDVTELHAMNQQLKAANADLESSRTEIQVQNEQLFVLATRDPLSGALNRRALFDAFERKITEARSAGRQLACLMIDIDHFKRINDTFGHAVGDKVITEMARILINGCRETDLVGRYGGEEFCTVLTGSNAADFISRAEQIREEVARRSPAWFESDYKVTASIGVALLHDGIITPMDLVNLADQALYTAKTGGRNRVVRWTSSVPVQEAEIVTQEHEPVSETPVSSGAYPESDAGTGDGGDRDARAVAPDLRECAEQLRKATALAVRPEESVQPESTGNDGRGAEEEQPQDVEITSLAKIISGEAA